MPAGARSAGRAGLCAWENPPDGGRCARAAPGLPAPSTSDMDDVAGRTGDALCLYSPVWLEATRIPGAGENPPGNAQGSDKSTRPALVTGEMPGKPFRRRNLALVSLVARLSRDVLHVHAHGEGVW